MQMDGFNKVQQRMRNPKSLVILGFAFHVEESLRMLTSLLTVVNRGPEDDGQASEIDMVARRGLAIPSGLPRLQTPTLHDSWDPGHGRIGKPHGCFLC